jgi:hypothetical protein
MDPYPGHRKANFRPDHADCGSAIQFSVHTPETLHHRQLPLQSGSVLQEISRIPIDPELLASELEDKSNVVRPRAPELATPRDATFLKDARERVLFFILYVLL